MNHKRGKPKNARSGCLFCKPHKMNGAKDADTLDVKIADQPEEGRWGNSTKPKRNRWPRAAKISCRLCGVLLETRACATRYEYGRAQNDRFRARCVECNKKLERDRAEWEARNRARV